MGILELIAGIIIGISIGSFDREPVLPNDSTRVSQAYYNVYYDVHFRNSYSDPYWNRGYYYGVNHYVDTPRYVYVKPKKKWSGEYLVETKVVVRVEAVEEPQGENNEK